MKHSFLAAALVFGSALGVLGASQAISQQIKPAPGHAVQMHPPMPGDAPGGMPPGPGPLQLAARLSAAEIYLGIMPDQLGLWRAYATALQDLLGSGFGPGAPKSIGYDDANSGLMGESFADTVITAGDKAKALKDVAAALKQKLTPTQTEKIAHLEEMLAPPQGRPPMPPGPHMDMDPQD